MKKKNDIRRYIIVIMLKNEEEKYGTEGIIRYDNIYV